MAGAQRRRRVVGTIVVGVAALAGVITLAVVDHSSTTGFDTSSRAFVLPRLGAPGKVSLASLRGRPVIVNFFASWCTQCAAELPVFARDAGALQSQAAFVEVNALETGDGLAFAQSFGLSSSATVLARDVGGSQGDGLYQSLGGTGSMPVTAFYSSQGTLLTTHVGAFDAATLAGELHQLYGITVPA